MEPVQLKAVRVGLRCDSYVRDIKAFFACDHGTVKVDTIAAGRSMRLGSTIGTKAGRHQRQCLSG